MLLNIFKTYLYAFNSETNETNLANGVYNTLYQYIVSIISFTSR